MKNLSFLDHLEELRKRIIHYLIFLSLATILAFIFIKPLVRIFTHLANFSLIILTPQEGIVTIMKIGFLGGVVLSLPFLIFQIWKFISYALTNEEKKVLVYYSFFAGFLFILGILLAYFVVIPLGLSFLINTGKEFYTPMISFESYFSFIVSFLFISGLIFQIPIIILFLNSIGIISKQQLKDKRRYFYLAAFIIAGVLTPTVDAFTQIIVAIPIIFLYEISYLIIFFRKNNIPIPTPTSQENK